MASSTRSPKTERDAARAEGTTLVARRPHTPEQQRLRLIVDGHEWIVDEARPTLAFGRATTNEVCLGDEFASRHHGDIAYGETRIRLTDRSTNGTLIVRGTSCSFYLNHETLLLFGEGEIHLGRLDGVAMQFTVETLAPDGRTWQPTWHSQPEAEFAPVEGNILRREGDFWTLAYEGTVLRMKDAKALHYLAHLMRHPGHDIAALDLIRAVADGRPDDTTTTATSGSRLSDPPLAQGSAGTTLDATAKAAYQRRLADLREDLDEAERFSDLGNIERARQEIAFLEREMAAAVGLGGRDRPVASHVERARVGVTVPLRALLKKLQGCHPALGHHLSTTIRTGRLCSYNPDPTSTVTWLL